MLCVLALAAGCGGGGGGGGGDESEARAESLGCGATLTVETPLGTLSSNAWNRAAAGQFAWSQCLDRYVQKGPDDYGWRWQWPTDGSTVFAYPRLLLGPDPWQAGVGRSDARFPRPLAATRRLVADVDVETVSDGRYNQALSMWLIRTPSVTEARDESAIATELMVWTDYSDEDFDAPTLFVGNVTLGGVEWALYADPSRGARPEDSAHRWSFVAYVARERRTAARIDLRALLDDAIARGLVDPALHIADLELGNEVVSGSGTSRVRRFEVEVE